MRGALHSPLEQEEVEVVVALGQKVPQNSSRIARTNLIGRQAKVKTLDKVPELGNQVLVEAPAGRQTVGYTVLPMISDWLMRRLPLSDCRQDEEHPEVNPKDQNHLEDQLS